MIINIADLPSDISGKTWRQKNREIKHKIPIDTLVEVLGNVDDANYGIRLYVCKYQRDCDETPLYGLTWNKNDYNRFKNTKYESHYFTGGYPESALRIIKEGDK